MTEPGAAFLESIVDAGSILGVNFNDIPNMSPGTNNFKIEIFKLS